MNNQPKPDSKTYDDLTSGVKKGIIKVPKFQRDFVWDLKATAKLLDSDLEEQCNDRVHRIGQTKPVTVHVPMAIHPGYQQNSFDCLLHSLMARKRQLASSALWPMGDTDEDAASLQQMLADENAVTTSDPVSTAIVMMFQRDDTPIGARNSDGSMSYRSSEMLKIMSYGQPALSPNSMSNLCGARTIADLTR